MVRNEVEIGDEVRCYSIEEFDRGKAVGDSGIEDP